jgi:hypothetical protein
MGSNKRGSNKRGSNKRGSNKRGSNKRGSNRKNHFTNKINKTRVSRKLRKRVTGGSFIDSVKTKVTSLISNVTEYFKPKDTYSIESFEGNFNTLFD